MEHICSDTNVWIDFSVTGRPELPFRLPYTYIMGRYALADELLSPHDLGKTLIDLGLVPVELSDDELETAGSYAGKYIRLSSYDSIALAIAKCRNMMLLRETKRCVMPPYPKVWSA